MEQSALPHHGNGPRHSILDLAPLELECMSVLWPLGEGTVRDIHRQLAASLPRAYTTIMTIMDRLAHKGIVTRRRVGRSYRYHANLSADEARVSAIEKIVTGFFHGSAEALAAHLAAGGGATRSNVIAPARIDLHRGEALPGPLEFPKRVPVDKIDTPAKESVTQQLDETLL